MKKSKIKLVSMISLISVLLLSVSATFAWFYMNSDVEVQYGSDIVCETGTSLEVSMFQGLDEQGEEIWSDYASSVAKSDISAKLLDITGDGINLYTPLKLEGDQAGDIQPTDFKKADPIDENGFGDYIELRLKFRSASTMNVYFGGESSILPISTDINNSTNVFGKFSQDYIAGAMRVAVIVKDELKMIWAPNPKYELYKYNRQYYFTENGQIETYKYYQYNEEEEKYELYNVTNEDLAFNRFIIGSTDTNDVMINKSPLIASLRPTKEVKLAEAEATLKIWFEGCDREANQALSGGHTKMKLIFSGISVKEDVTVENKNLVDSVNYELVETKTIEKDKDGKDVEVITYSYKFNNVTNDMYFSTDGYIWTKYDGTNLPDMYKASQESNGANIFFKVKETQNNLGYIRKVFVEKHVIKEETEEQEG